MLLLPSCPAVKPFVTLLATWMESSVHCLCTPKSSPFRGYSPAPLICGLHAAKPRGPRVPLSRWTHGCMDAGSSAGLHSVHTSDQPKRPTSLLASQPGSKGGVPAPHNSMSWGSLALPPPIPSWGGWAGSCFRSECPFASELPSPLFRHTQGTFPKGPAARRPSQRPITRLSSPQTFWKERSCSKVGRGPLPDDCLGPTPACCCVRRGVPAPSVHRDPQTCSWVSIRICLGFLCLPRASAFQTAGSTI